MEPTMEPNFYIFVNRWSNFKVTARHLVYGANIARPEHRALCNVKPGDIVFIYVMEHRSLYGPFLAEGRVFEDRRDIGWKAEGKAAEWYHRVPLKPWTCRIGVVDRYALYRLYRSIRDKLKTIRDIDDLHRRYLNTLLRDEGLAFFEAFLEEAEFVEPQKIIEDFGFEPIRGTPLDARILLQQGKLAEYVIELYLLQHPDKLAEVVGANFAEVYNQVYVYQNRFLDIMTIHRMGDNVLKVTIVEIKSACNEETIANGLEELGHYMSTVADWLSTPLNRVHGVLLTPSSNLEDAWKSARDEIATVYGILPNRILWIRYSITPAGDMMLS